MAKCVYCKKEGKTYYIDLDAFTWKRLTVCLKCQADRKLHLERDKHDR